MEDSQPQCIEWIWSLLGECITTQQQAWSFLLGYVSIFCWLNAQIPQIIENFKLGSAASLSLPFLINWLLGDISNLIGCILTHQLPFQLYLAIYFCIADVILFGQWIFYSHREYRRRTQLELAIADLPEITEAESHHRHHHHRTHSRHSRKNTATTDILNSISTDLLSNTEDATDVGVPSESNQAAAQSLQSPRPRRLTTTSDIAHRKSTSIVLFGIALLTMKQALPVLQHDPSYSGFLSNGGSAPSPIARVFSRALAADQTLGEEPSPPDDQYIVHLGRIFAWVCTIFYLSSRMPQLWKNFQRKSVQGLSILMFFWAAMGNLSYTLSILNSADAVNPDTRTKFLREAVPYVLGSSGTLMFDLSIFGQWLYYTGKLYMIGIGPRPSHRRHRHRHHHSRQSRSRSRSRVESMALSPSGSQGGIYSVLVDEDDSEVAQDPLESLQEVEPSIHSAPLHQGQIAMDQTHISIGN